MAVLTAPRTDPKTMSDILQTILARKAEEVAQRRAQRPLEELQAAVASAPPVRGFVRALQVPAPMIGINNRNLRTFEVSLQTTLDMQQAVPRDRLLVTESGILGPQDVALMRDAGIHAFLVGEAFMRVEEPGEGLRQLFFAA